MILYLMFCFIQFENIHFLKAVAQAVVSEWGMVSWLDDVEPLT